MKVEHNVENNIFTIRYELDDIEMKILLYLQQEGYIEFRSGREIDHSGQFTFEQLESLKVNRFIKVNLDSWHNEYNLSSQGKRFLGMK